MPASNYLQNKLLDYLFRGQAMPANPVIYVALLTCTKGSRQNSFTYAVNDTITLLANNGTQRLYKCTAITTGISTSAQGVLFPGVANEVIVDTGATFTDQDSVLRAVGATFVEPSGNAYARVKAAAGASQALTDWKSTQNDSLASTGTSGSTNNTNTVAFPQATPAGWAVAPAMVWGIALMDAITTGNCLDIGGLTTPQAVAALATPSFAAGQITIPMFGNGL